MAEPSVRITVQLPAALYAWLKPTVQRRELSALIVRLLEQEKAK